MRKPTAALVGLLLSAAIIAGCAKREAAPPQPQPPAYITTDELKQKCRDLAAQLLETQPGTPIKGTIGVPAAFINEADPAQSTSLGRMMAEALTSGLNDRGFATREYDLAANATGQGGINDVALAKKLKRQKLAALLIGTYSVSQDGTYINARLISGKDGSALGASGLATPNLRSEQAGSGAYVAPQFAPVLPPSYPSLSGLVVQPGTASIPIVQGR